MAAVVAAVSQNCPRDGPATVIVDNINSLSVLLEIGRRQRAGAEAEGQQRQKQMAREQAASGAGKAATTSGGARRRRQRSGSRQKKRGEGRYPIKTSGRLGGGGWLRRERALPRASGEHGRHEHDVGADGELAEDQEGRGEDGAVAGRRRKRVKRQARGNRGKKREWR